MSASRGCRCSRHNTDSAGRFLKTLVRQPCSVTVVVVQEKKSPHHLVSSTNQMALVHPRLTVKKKAVPSVCFFLDLWVHVFVSFRGEIYSGLPSLAVSACSQEMGEIGFGSVRISRTVCHSNTHIHSHTHTHTHTSVHEQTANNKFKFIV